MQSLPGYIQKGELFKLSQFVQRNFFQMGWKLKPVLLIQNSAFGFGKQLSGLLGELTGEKVKVDVIVA